MLELLGLSKAFGKHMAVYDISLSIEKGEIRGLIGPNGSGKSTLFDLITGFLRPTSGKVILRGENLTGKPAHFIARKGIARTFQLTSIYDELTVIENVIMACHLRTGMGIFEPFFGLKKARHKEKNVEIKAFSLLELMGIEREMDRFAMELPGGTQRILAIAIALASDPELLLLDEPLAGLNATEKTLMTDKLKVIQDKGITIFIVEHDMKTIMSICDKVTVINFGIKIAEGSPKKVSCDKKTIEAYLGGGNNNFT